ncbi:MAG TPA: cyclic nucleotide-binding domain-containing protein [Lacipirellulaceae bacterium]|jgi:Fe-S-cluster-containing dehydrogenase component/CRP-like cAMP-binding protein
MVELEIAVPRPQRWDVPFGDRMSESDVDRLLSVDPFRRADATAFPLTLPLRGVLRNDTRIVHFENGDLIVREGDYGHSAFMILDGAVRVALKSLDPQLLGRSTPTRPTWRRALAQLWQNAKLPEVRREFGKSTVLPDSVGIRQESDGTRIFLQDIPRQLDRTGTVRLEAGEIFGELAALARTPRTATVFADGPITLLEIRWQGLRDLMRRTPAIREHVERLYRENSLLVHLRETPLLDKLSASDLSRVAAATVFESYGNFDWYTDFGAERTKDPAATIAAEPLIAREGDVPTGLLLVRSGFARISRRRGHGEQTVAYLGKGQAFGLAELIKANETGQDVPLRCSLRAVGYVDILRIPSDVVINAILPTARTAKQTSQSSTSAVTGQSSQSAASAVEQPAIDPRTLDFLSDHRFLNGTETMLINLDRCTRCDDCVRACAATHDNNPRFVRQGPKHDQFMVANACMHCVDPVCMIGCPTGAIGRDQATGVVRINDRTCIGCSTCANSCPYDAIRMVEIRDTDGVFFFDEATNQPILKATKCDLCSDQLTGPACQQACPHDALVRIDMSDQAALASWLGR